MQKQFVILFSIVLPSLIYSREIVGKIDSVGFHKNGNLAYVHEQYSSRISEYTYHENGHLKTIKNLWTDEPSYSFQTYSESGKLLFDTSYSNNYYATCTHYYSNGAKKSYYSKKLHQQSNDSPILTQYFAWDENGELNYFREVDTSGRVAADEKYPLRKYRSLKFHRSFFPSGNLKEQGFFKPSSIDSLSPVNKYGVWFTFFSNGKIQTAGLFIENIPWGLHYEYDSTGKLLSLKYFVKGILLHNEPGISILPINAIFGTDTVRSYQWNHFGNEGLYENGTSYDYAYNHSYYFHGANLANTPNPFPKGREKEKSMGFGFPPGDVWCTWSLYSIQLNEEENIIRISEGISENSYAFYPTGVLQEWNRGTLKTKYTYNSNGSISKIETSGQQRTWFMGNTYPVIFQIDTTRFYDREGRIATMSVYGTRGQILKTLKRNPDSSWVETLNPNYQHFYIMMKEQWVEILDHDATFTGEWKFVCENGNKVMEGFYDGGKNGLWKDYNRNTGKLQTIQYYEDNKPAAKGIYEQYDGNAKLTEKGQYDVDGKKTGIWKRFDNGKKLSRIRYFQGYEYGFVRCKKCCPNKKGKARNQLTFFWKGNDIWKLRKCRRRMGWYD